MILKRWISAPLACIMSMAWVLVSSPIHAQESDEVDEEDEVIETIIVTGSRIRRDSFSSPSPIQVLDVESGRQLGIASISEMLQRATVANGTQIDASLNTNSGNSNASEAPPTGGVGSSSIDLRGLGPERTLVLINGRRLGSAGVRGAPAQPDINLIPFSMVERVEVLTEGVSAVYGADAVAGVVNVILRDEFEGLEISANKETPNDRGGDINSISLIAGVVSDRGSFTFGAEAFDRSRILVGDRNYSRCLRRGSLDVTENGDIIDDICFQTFFDNIILAPGVAGADDIWIFYSPGMSNLTGIPNYSTYTGIPEILDPSLADPRFGDFDSFANFGFFDFYNDQDERRAADLVSPLKRFSLMTIGKINMDWWANEEIYIEAYYLNRQLFSRASTEQIFPDILGMIPQEDAAGNIIVDAAGVPILVLNPLNPLGVDALPIMTLEDITQHRNVEVEQSRLVLGLRGDFGNSSWTYDVFGSYDRGIGFQSQEILYEPNLILATQTIRMDASGNVICGIANPTSGFGGFDTPNECVPLDIFGVNSGGASTWTGGETGEGILTQAERDYLLGNRTNRTVVEQTLFSGFATGDLFEMGGRTVAGVIGFEYRKDEINSQNDIGGVRGLNAAENPLQEGETIGSRDLTEFFGEINVPLLDNLNFDAAIRFTDESNFGSETTYRGRISWSPVDYLTLSGSAGTSFRAPNLREQFLAAQGGGIGGGNDPCLNATIQLGMPEEPDSQSLIQRCIDSGIVFTDSNMNGTPDTNVLGTQGVTTIPTSTGGNVELLAETSDSFTTTIQFTQPWSEAFDFDIAVSYWSVEIQDTVEEPNAAFIIGQCFGNFDLPDFNNNAFCDLLSRPTTGSDEGRIINFVDISFINIGEETAKGIDVNTRLLLDWGSYDIAWATAITKQLEQETEIFGPEDRDDNVGEIGTPELKFTSTLSVAKGDWEFLMQNRFIDEGQQDNSPAFAANPRFAFGIAAVPILSRDVDFIDSSWFTDMSVTYRKDTWSATLGINNVFEEEPPLIDDGEGPNRNNAVTSSGYDFYGRTVFATFAASFQ